MCRSLIKGVTGVIAVHNPFVVLEKMKGFKGIMLVTLCVVLGQTLVVYAAPSMADVQVRSLSQAGQASPVDQQTTQAQPCPNLRDIGVVQNFNMSAFEGLWYTQLYNKFVPVKGQPVMPTHTDLRSKLVYNGTDWVIENGKKC